MRIVCITCRDALLSCDKSKCCQLYVIVSTLDLDRSREWYGYLCTYVLVVPLCFLNFFGLESLPCEPISIQNKPNSRPYACIDNHGHIKPVVLYYSFTTFDESRTVAEHVFYYFFFIFAISASPIVYDAQLVEVLVYLTETSVNTQ